MPTLPTPDPADVWGAQLNAAVESLALQGDHASRPTTDIVIGTLYSCSDHNLIYRWDGAAWGTYATLGAGGGGPTIVTKSLMDAGLAGFDHVIKSSEQSGGTGTTLANVPYLSFPLGGDVERWHVVWNLWLQSNNVDNDLRISLSVDETYSGSADAYLGVQGQATTVAISGGGSEGTARTAGMMANGYIGAWDFNYLTVGVPPNTGVAEPSQFFVPVHLDLLTYADMPAGALCQLRLALNGDPTGGVMKVKFSSSMIATKLA